MSKYIKVEYAIEAAINGCASWDGGYFPSMDDPIKDEFASIEDKCIEIVRCGECYYKDEKRIMDEDKLWCRKHHMYVTADWFCADGERGETQCSSQDS